MRGGQGIPGLPAPDRRPGLCRPSDPPFPLLPPVSATDRGAAQRCAGIPKGRGEPLPLAGFLLFRVLQQHTPKCRGFPRLPAGYRRFHATSMQYTLQGRVSVHAAGIREHSAIDRLADAAVMARLQRHAR